MAKIREGVYKMTFTDEQVNNWKKESEERASKLGKEIMILEKDNLKKFKLIGNKWNLIKTIFAIIGIILIIFLAGTFVMASNLGSLDGNSFIVKIVYSLDFSPELKSYLNGVVNRSIEMWRNETI